MVKKPGSTSDLNFNQGRALCKIASEYPTLYEVIMEAVQNAIDAGAASIEIMLNRKNRNIIIHDDGAGVSMQKFQQALSHVCESAKERGKLGQFGIGLISPLGKCTRFVFTSCPKETHTAYTEWTFVTDDIREQPEQVSVPHRERTDLIFKDGAKGGHRRGLTPVDWRTEMAIFSYTRDKVVSRIQSAQSLLDGITERYGAAMRRNDTRIGIAIINEDGTQDLVSGKAKRFTGKKLQDVTLSTEGGGNTTVRIYLARKTEKGYCGHIMVGEADNDFRVKFAQLAKCGLIDSDIADAMNSGVFEGEFLSEKAQLHENRRGFKENEALMGFCVAIEQWYREHGKAHYEAAQEQREDQRLQELGLKSMKNLEQLLKLPLFSDVRDALRSFKEGTVGNGHQLPTETAVLGKQNEKSIAVTGGTRGHEGSDEKSRQPDEAMNGHHPYTVAGPKGKQRTVVRSDSLGLQFSHVAMEGSDKLFELDARQGILRFNIRHPIWVACDREGKGNREIMQLQEVVAIQALLLETRPEDWRKHNDLYVEDMLRPMAHLICSSSSFAVFGRPRKELN